VFSADEYFVLDAHAEAVKMLRELRVSRDVHAYRTMARVRTLRMRSTSNTAQGV
jgi:hypothetical protein